MTHGYGGTEEVEVASVCAVYDSVTGRIHHWHHCVTIAGGHHPSEEEIAADALAAGERFASKNRADLEVIHVPLDAIEPGKGYCVDPQRQTLVEEHPLEADQ
jgi:hypothetical protein